MHISPYLNVVKGTTHHKKQMSSSIKCTYRPQQRNLNHLQKMEDISDDGYDSDGEIRTLFDAEDLEDN